MPPQKKTLVLALALLAVVAVLAVLDERGISPLPAPVFLGLRWLMIAIFALHAIQRRSLTTWILVSMLVGAEIGHDFPLLAQNLRVLSLAFLRLIKTIIAPLLFATLVVGIAGHSDLRQVGRMGIKALLYFEG